MEEECVLRRVPKREKTESENGVGMRRDKNDLAIDGTQTKNVV